MVNVKCKMLKIPLLLTLFAICYLLFAGFASAQTQFIHISWKVTNAPSQDSIKNLPVDSSILVVGVTHYIIERGKILNDSDVDFSWRIEPDRDYVLPNAPQFTIRIDQMPGQTNITVYLRIKSLNTSNVYEKAMVIPIVSPYVALFKYDPALNYTSPFNSIISKSEGQVNLRAKPFYFTLPTQQLSFSWKLNDQPLSGSPERPDIILFDTAQFPLGEYRLFLDLSNPYAVAQYLTTRFNITLIQ